MRMQWKTLAAVLLILACAGVASAGTLGLTFVNDSPAQTGVISGTYGGLTGGPYWIGQSNFSVTDRTNAPADDALALWLEAKKPANNWYLHGYCIDTYQTIGYNHPDVWDVVNLNTNPAGAPTLIKGLSGTDAEKAAVAAAKVVALQRLFANHGGTGNDADKAAAMAAAVWEIVNETPANGYTLSDGIFRVTQSSGNWVATANGWLTDGLPITGPTPILYALVDPLTQDFVIAIAGVGIENPIPEPFTMLTASLAIGGLGMYVRRRSGRSGLAG